jgi:hypothetical protein
MCSPEFIFRLTLTSTRQAVDQYLALPHNHHLRKYTISPENWERMEEFQVILGVGPDPETQKSKLTIYIGTSRSTANSVQRVQPRFVGCHSII